jgi:hypothetical protein
VEEEVDFQPFLGVVEHAVQCQEQQRNVNAELQVVGVVKNLRQVVVEEETFLVEEEDEHVHQILHYKVVVVEAKIPEEEEVVEVKSWM